MYLVFDEDNKLVGLLNIRFDLTDELREIYGDIGYGVRPSERRKGHATRMLKFALDICREKNMKNGGFLYRNDYEEEKLSKDWKINLKCNYYKVEL